MNILDKILETKRVEIAESVLKESYDEIFHRARNVSRSVVSFSKALKTSRPAIIAEFKRRSPSKGYINEKADALTIVKGYAEKGAAAISVLTDSDYFGGSLDDLVLARKTTNLPLLRKDFIIDSYQICQARIAGADIILLIAAAMNPQSCTALARFARELGMEVLLEIHNPSELEYINDFVNVVGVNNRDLTTFVTDTTLSERLVAMIPDKFVKISESGISSSATVKRLYDLGYTGFLMGENFMKHSNPADALEQFIAEL
jgi:indole-3-glycerol phosphate synthase